ncbi:hypothetical protein D3C87_1379640 [compost metagenome]
MLGRPSDSLTATRSRAAASCACAATMAGCRAWASASQVCKSSRRPAAGSAASSSSTTPASAGKPSVYTSTARAFWNSPSARLAPRAALASALVACRVSLCEPSPRCARRCVASTVSFARTWYCSRIRTLARAVCASKYALTVAASVFCSTASRLARAASSKACAERWPAARPPKSNRRQDRFSEPVLLFKLPDGVLAPG